MLTIKGFASHTKLFDNTQGSTAMFGELSPHARSFSREISSYTNAQAPDLVLDVFVSKTETEARAAVSTELQEQILKICAWCYTEGLTFTSSTTKADFATKLLGQFFGVITDLTIADLATSANRKMPSWISFKVSGTTANTVKIWFNNNAFEQEYDDYEIVIIPPMDNLNTFFRPLSEINAALAARNISKLTERLQEAKNKKPETILRVETVDYINPNTNVALTTNWGVLIYGPQGDNPDARKAALVAYILAHSNEPATNWKQIVPDLFRTTQMFILPRWTKYAIPNRTDKVGIYSPISSVTESLTFAKGLLTQLPAAHIEQNLQVSHHTYSSISFLSVGGIDNYLNKFKLSDYFSDYIAQSSTGQDFNRQEETTKEWSNLLDKALQTAESMTAISSLPNGFRRTTIGTKLCVAFTYNKVEYILVSKNG